MPDLLNMDQAGRGVVGLFMIFPCLKRRKFALAQNVFPRTTVPFLSPDLPEDGLGRPFRRIKARARQVD